MKYCQIESEQFSEHLFLMFNTLILGIIVSHMAAGFNILTNKEIIPRLFIVLYIDSLDDKNLLLGW
jgi:hypothetical protein